MTLTVLNRGLESQGTCRWPFSCKCVFCPGLLVFSFVAGAGSSSSPERLSRAPLQSASPEPPQSAAVLWAEGARAALARSPLLQAWSRPLWQQFYPWSIRGWKPDSVNHSQSSLLHKVILNVHVLKSSEVVILSAFIRILEKSYENITEVLELGRSFQGW